jgi:hypothetical protein
MRRLILLAAFIPTVAFAHDAIPTAAQPEGWTYPIMCCSLRDCRPTQDAEVDETRDGYKVASTGEFVPHGDKRIKELSQDGKIHICQQGGNFDSGRVLCLLIPPRAF